MRSAIDGRRRYARDLLDPIIHSADMRSGRCKMQFLLQFSIDDMFEKVDFACLIERKDNLSMMTVGIFVYF